MKLIIPFFNDRYFWIAAMIGVVLRGNFSLGAFVPIRICSGIR
jgi:hypothetical protein